MPKLRHLLLAGLIGAASAPLFAQDAPASPFTITGGATLISDYRFRGLSQTNRRFALQGTIGVAHSSGFYIGTWGSSIDDYVANGGDQEIDLYGGYKKTINGTTVDGGLLYYYYPGSGGANTDFFEPYLNVSHSFGPLSAKLGGNFSWSQHGLATTTKARAAGAYGYAELSAAIPNTGFTVTGHLGHSFVRNYITFDTHYTDWSVTAAYSWKALTFSAAYVDTDKTLYSYPNGGGHNRDIAKGGFVGAVAVAF
ncbi:TorF family putative porin [Sphingomonas morindae]|uniref:TorF family putative porin n=1 Tax=Sphingomonas morindae TaxID=1541170 RepID=A0ABY4XC12_9SPHN|nr:TorF family putative porin [Sphingomonas morindae]USI74452.1 TorF family putative porin [Sphingomonas morindae]